MSYASIARPRFQRESKDEEGSEDQSNEDGDYPYDEDKEPKNPYDYNLDIEVGMHISHDDLKDSLAQLPKALEKPRPGMRAETLVVDKNIIASRLVHLQIRGVILYTVDFNPSCDVFED